MPFWAPDGQRIGFTSWGRNGNYQEALYIINADGSNERLLVIGISRVGGVDWSPDGKRIVFDSDHEAKWSEIYIINEDGSGFRRITDNPGSTGGPSDPVISGGNLSPSWSPDGSRIVFASRRAAKPGIYTMNPDGSNQVWLADGWGPQWLQR